MYNALTIITRSSNMTARIGFACKFIDRPDQVDGVGANDDCKQYNTGTTTLTWLRRQSAAARHQRLADLLLQNTEATRRLVERVGQFDASRRMVRLSSDILPAYTAPEVQDFWQSSEIRSLTAAQMAQIGDAARRLDVRISFHPGQYTVLASEADQIVENSVREFEYHADMARMMGYGQKFQDMKINVHISGRRGPAGIRSVFSRLSSEARNCITFENEEMGWGLDSCLELADLCPIVLDIHHHWVKTGEYIDADDSRIARIIDSWRDVRPVIHYSTSREDELTDHCVHTRPDMAALLESGFKKQRLRAHSDFMWNSACNDWALSHLTWGDIMVEAKSKNLASGQLAERATELRLISK